MSKQKNVTVIGGGSAVVSGGSVVSEFKQNPNQKVIGGIKKKSGAAELKSSIKEKPQTQRVKPQHKAAKNTKIEKPVSIGQSATASSSVIVDKSKPKVKPPVDKVLSTEPYTTLKSNLSEAPDPIFNFKEEPVKHVRPEPKPATPPRPTEEKIVEDNDFNTFSYPQVPSHHTTSERVVRDETTEEFVSKNENRSRFAGRYSENAFEIKQSVEDDYKNEVQVEYPPAPSKYSRNVQQDVTEQLEREEEAQQTSDYFNSNITDNHEEAEPSEKLSKLFSEVQDRPSDSIKDSVNKKRTNWFSFYRIQKLMMFLLMLIVLSGLLLFVYVYFVNKNLLARDVNIELNTSVFADSDDIEAYKTWSNEHFQEVEDPAEDEDKDGLTNYEEYITGGVPNDSNSCSADQNDLAYYLSKKSLKDCSDNGLSNPDNLITYGKIVNFNMDYFLSTFYNSQNVTAGSSIATLFGDTNLEDIDLEFEYGDSDKVEAVEDIEKVQQKLNGRDDNPITALEYADAAYKYDIDIELVAAVAEYQSDYGQGDKAIYKNVAHLGLASEGFSYGFADWKSGLEGYAKWYKVLDKLQFSDCEKWQILTLDTAACDEIENLRKSY